MSKSRWVATDFIANAKRPGGYSAGDIVEFIGWSTSGDGGAAQWKATGNVIAPSQTPELLGTTKCSDASGNEFEIADLLVTDKKLGYLDATDFTAFANAVDQTQKTKNSFTEEDFTNHNGVARYASTVSYAPYGSGINGPATADFAKGISIVKKGWPNRASAQVGEIDALTITSRQTGPDFTIDSERSDSAGLLINSQATSNCGFVAASEMEATQIDPDTFAIVRKARLQAAPLDRDAAFGAAIITDEGAFDDILRITRGSTATADTMLKYVVSGTGAVFEIGPLGQITQYNPTGANPVRVENSDKGWYLYKWDNSLKVRYDLTNDLALFNMRVKAGTSFVAAPLGASPTLEAGTIATDDGTNWSGVNATGSPRPVYYDGTAWIAMT